MNDCTTIKFRKLTKQQKIDQHNANQHRFGYARITSVLDGVHAERQCHRCGRIFDAVTPDRDSIETALADVIATDPYCK